MYIVENGSDYLCCRRSLILQYRRAVFVLGLVYRVFCRFIGLQLPRPRGVFHSILVFMSALPKEGMVIFSSNFIGQSTNLLD